MICKTDFREGGLLPPHPSAAPKRPILSRVNAKKISLNMSETELAMFSPPKIQLDHELKIKLNGIKNFVRLIWSNF